MKIKLVLLISTLCSSIAFAEVPFEKDLVMGHVEPHIAQKLPGQP